MRTLEKKVRMPAGEIMARKLEPGECVDDEDCQPLSLAEWLASEAAARLPQETWDEFCDESHNGSAEYEIEFVLGGVVVTFFQDDKPCLDS